MPSYPLSQFSDLEEMMCKVNKKSAKKVQRGVGKVESGAKVGQVMGLTFAS